MNLAKKLLDQHKQRIKFDYSGELPEWAITICKENLSSQLEPQVMQKIAGVEINTLKNLMYYETIPLEEKEKLINIFEKFGIKFTEEEKQIMFNV